MFLIRVQEGELNCLHGYHSERANYRTRTQVAGRRYIGLDHEHEDDDTLEISEVERHQPLENHADALIVDKPLGEGAILPSNNIQQDTDRYESDDNGLERSFNLSRKILIELQIALSLFETTLPVSDTEQRVDYATQRHHAVAEPGFREEILLKFLHLFF